MDTQLKPFPMLSCPFLPIPVHLRTSKCHKRNGTCKLIVNCKKSTNILKTFQVDWSFDQCKSIPKQTKHWKTNCPNLAQWRYLLCRTQTTISRWFQWKNWWKIAWGYQYFHHLDGPLAWKRFQLFSIFVIRTPWLLDELDKFLYLWWIPDLPIRIIKRSERCPLELPKSTLHAVSHACFTRSAFDLHRSALYFLLDSFYPNLKYNCLDLPPKRLLCQKLICKVHSCIDASNERIYKIDQIFEMIFKLR